jgi:hypothetical protein
MLEILGGVLLVRCTLILPTATVLAVIMLVASVADGIIHASPIPSDTLAPGLLAAMIYLIRAELQEHMPSPGDCSRDDAPSESGLDDASDNGGRAATRRHTVVACDSSKPRKHS